MSTNLPRWADADLSAKLPSIREAGESESVEFKETIPDQATHKLAPAIAALATFGGGLLLVGVNDNCELVGIDAADHDARDEVRLRVQGIVSNISPRPNVEILFAVESGKTVLVFKVLPKQAEPVFYYDGRPYIRDGSSKRVATPDEVKERVWKHPSAEFKRAKERMDLETLQASAEQMRQISRTSAKMFER